MKIFLNASYSCDFQSWIFSVITLEIILIFWFAAQKTFIISFVTLQMSLSSLLINLKHPCWIKVLISVISLPPTKKRLYWLQVSCCRKQTKIEQQEEHVAGDGLIIENNKTIWLSASRRRCESGSTSGFLSNGCNLSSSAHERYFKIKIKMPSKLFWRQSVPFRNTLI